VRKFPGCCCARPDRAAKAWAAAGPAWVVA